MKTKRINRHFFLFLTIWIITGSGIANAQSSEASLIMIKADSLKIDSMKVLASKAFLGSEATVRTDQLSSTMATTLIPALMGRMAGLNITQYRGTRLHQSFSNVHSVIGGLSPNFGSSVYSDNTEFSINARGKGPVVIIDGVQRELYSLDPEAIESVSIRKDALSSLFLGMRSSRGALIITTRKAESEGFHLSFTGRFGVQSPLKMPKPLPAYQYAYLLNEALQNDGKTPFYSYDDFATFRGQTSPYTHPDVDWYDQLMENSSTTQSYNLNVSGGNRFARYFINLGYINENGLFKTRPENGYNTNLDFDRYSLSSRVNIRITNDFTADVTMMGRLEEGNQPGGNGNGYSDLLLAMYTTPNNAYPVFNPNGSWGGNVSFNNNLLSQAINSGYITDNTRDVLGAVCFKYDFDKMVKGLSVRMIGNLSAQYRSTINRTKRSEVYQYAKNEAGNYGYTMYGSSSMQSNFFTAVSNYQYMQGEFAVDYERRFGMHGLKATVSGDTRQVLVDYNLPELPSNLLTDLSYDYDRRYFAQAALTGSYYNRYAPGKRWGAFWAFGLGWDISQESFLKDIRWIDLLKLRGVFGQTGDGMDNSGYYDYRQSFNWNNLSNYYQGSSQQMGHFTYETSPMSNPNKTWEKAYKLNIGTDISLFANRLQLTVDYFNDKYVDMLQTRGKSIELMGIAYPQENIGKLRQWGAELSLTWKDRIGKFNYYATGNWSTLQSKLLYMDEQDVPWEYLRHTGQPVGAVWGLVADGFFTSEKEIAASPVMVGYENIRPGDIKYKDLNNDKVIDEFDRTIIGGDKPISYFGLDLGLEYRGIEFSMLWQGVYNRDIYLNDWTLMEGFQSINQHYGQAYENMLGRWTPETAETATFPRLTAGGNAYNRGGSYNSSFWMRSGNFIRLKNISLAYTLPDAFCRRFMGGMKVKLFVNGQNLFTQAACSLVDPEVSFTSYPLQRTISTGINIKFK